MRNSLLLLLVPFILITGCSGNHTLGMKSHDFGLKPKHVVWLQIPGLSIEHFAILKTEKTNTSGTTLIEGMECLGSAWSYNLLELRPGHFKGYQSQMMGLKSVKGTCDDLIKESVWDYYEKSGYQTALYESDAQKEKRLFELANCETKKPLFSNAIFWAQKREKLTSDEKTFHFQEDNQQSLPGVYYDRSCNEKGCFSGLLENVIPLWSNLVTSKPKTFFIARDASLLAHLKKKRFTDFKKKLLELEKLINFFQDRSQTDSILLLITSSEAMDVEFPKMGKDWLNLKRTLTYRRSKLQAPVWASGPSAENFCGVYEESEIFKRLLWAPEGNLFNLTL